MIRACIYLLLLFLCASKLSVSQTNSIVVVSETGHPFFMVVNADSCNKNEEFIIKAFNLSPGWQTIYIKTVINNTALELKDSIKIVDDPKYNNKEFTYTLSQQNRDLSLRFKSVSDHSGPNIPNIPQAPKETAPVIDNSIYGNLYQAKSNKPVFFYNYDTLNGSCNISLTEKDIQYALNLMKKANSEDIKLGYLNTIIKRNCYSTLQMRNLLELIPIDMDRLNSLKLAYPHFLDKENAAVLENLFKYQSVKEAYATFIKEEEIISNQKKLNCTIPVSDVKFEGVYNKIKSSGYEYEQIKSAKKALANICISTEQAKKLNRIFTHDRERLEFMKSAYFVITDKENIPSLAEEFQFAETKKEFTNYINQQHVK